jgi:nitroimidazol reductase NimA-like FMN-containing flavoprotein (pyridoxamine 5'-phosphate oxidase superfamily)
VARDPTLLEVLDRDACLQLLGSVAVGRIGLSINALPVVLPVNFAFDGPQGRIIVRTTEGGKLRAALSGAIVAFEADQIDPMSHAGWSVLVRGSAHVVNEPDELERVGRMPLRPWATEDSGDYWVAISADLVSGRRLRGWYGADAERSSEHRDGARGRLWP